jgi:aryl-alcohol dehydrogenase-like predicted oxidoreductase
MMEMALEAGVDAVDTHRATRTSQGYGDAQLRLRPWATRLRITTKAFGSSSRGISIPDQLAASLDELGVDRLHACLIHDWADLSPGEAARAGDGLNRARDLGMCEHIGVSVYVDEELVSALDFVEGIDVAQVPASPIDQRLSGGAGVREMQRRGAELQVRGLFAQGLLLPHNQVTTFDSHPALLRFRNFCSEHAIDPVRACLSYGKSISEATAVVIGASSPVQLEQVLRAWRSAPAGIDWSELACHDLDLIDPRRWPGN